MTPFDKSALLAQIVQTLQHDQEVLRQAAQTAYETATAEENIAENKYDTLGLEASYLATGQARRAAEIRTALLAFQRLSLRDHEDAKGVQVGQWVTLEDEAGDCRHFFLGPDAAGLKLMADGKPVTVITPRSPLGQQLLGKRLDEELHLSAAAGAQTYHLIAAG